MKKQLKDLFYPYVELLELIDHWLCIHLYPWRLRLWWQTLFSRQELLCSDEFETSLDSDYKIVAALMPYPAKLREYYTQLVLRRQEAHERDLVQS